MDGLFIRGIKQEAATDNSLYPFSIPAVQQIDTITFTNSVTFFVGENGSGKSTIIEAIAVATGFSAEGGTKNYNFSTENTTSILSDNITLIRGVKREKYGYFLRAESFYTAANYAEKGTFPNLFNGDNPVPLYFDNKRIHEHSHGEAFLAIVKEFRPGLFIFDEPESALSPQRLMHLMVAIHELAKEGSQFIIATHSPILLAYPGAVIYELSESGIARSTFQELEHVQVTREFLNHPSAFLDKLLHE